MVNIKDAYSHPLFYKEVDQKTGFKTRHILCFPIRSVSGEFTPLNFPALDLFKVHLSVLELCNFTHFHISVRSQLTIRHFPVSTRRRFDVGAYWNTLSNGTILWLVQNFSQILFVQWGMGMVYNFELQPIGNLDGCSVYRLILSLALLLNLIRYIFHHHLHRANYWCGPTVQQTQWKLLHKVRRRKDSWVRHICRSLPSAGINSFSSSNHLNKIFVTPFSFVCHLLLKSWTWNFGPFLLLLTPRKGAVNFNVQLIVQWVNGVTSQEPTSNQIKFIHFKNSENFYSIF